MADGATSKGFNFKLWFFITFGLFAVLAAYNGYEFYQKWQADKAAKDLADANKIP